MARSKNDEALGQAVETLAVGVWRWRLELTLTFGIIFVVLFTGLGGILVAGVLLAFISRHLLARLHASHVRRQWARACAETGVNARVRRVQPVVAGDRLQIRVGPRDTIKALEKAAYHLAERLRVREVRVARDPDNAQRAEVLILRRDPFFKAAPVPWPHLHDQNMSLWDSLPFAISEEGDTIGLKLIERNILIGGEPGGGKSVALSLLAATASKDPNTKLWILDGKRVELAAWAPCAERLVGPDGQEAIDLLKALQSVMEDRYRELLARGERKISRDSGLPLHLVICDELAFYLHLPDTKQRAMFTDLLRDLVARGRAAGIIVAAATQKSGTDLVPSSLRDLFAFRLAFRATTPEMSDVILGRGWASNDADSSNIPIGQRGVGYLLAEGERPIKIKTYYLSDEDIAGIASSSAGQDLEAAFAMPSAGSSISMSVLESVPKMPEPTSSVPTRTQTSETIARKILDVLPPNPADGLTTQALESRLQYSKRTWWATFRMLRDEGQILWVGKGKPGDPKRYYRAAA